MTNPEIVILANKDLKKAKEDLKIAIAENDWKVESNLHHEIANIEQTLSDIKQEGK